MGKPINAFGVHLSFTQGHLWCSVLKPAWRASLVDCYGLGTGILGVIISLFGKPFKAKLSIPSAAMVHIQKAIEHGHRNSGFTYRTWWFSSSLCGCLPEGRPYWGTEQALRRPMAVGAFAIYPRCVSLARYLNDGCGMLWLLSRWCA